MNVALFDTHSADAYITKTLPSGSGGFKIKVWLKAESSVLSTLYAAGPRSTADLVRIEYPNQFRKIVFWAAPNGAANNYGWIGENGSAPFVPSSGVAGAPIPLDSWLLMEQDWLLTTGTSWSYELFQAGSSLGSNTLDLAVDDTLTPTLIVGGRSANHLTGEEYRVARIEVRKADGTLVLLEDWTSGSFSTNGWTTHGSCSIVSDGSWTGLTPTNTVAPVASGGIGVGDLLSCTTGSWTNSPTSYAYQWQRDNSGGGVYSDIGGATSSSYRLASADLGCNVLCAVTATNGSGSTTANSNALGLIVADDVAPVLQAIATFRGKVVLRYNEALDPAGPATGEFAVTVNGSSRAVTAVAVADNQVLLTLASPVSDGDIVDVAYTG